LLCNATQIAYALHSWHCYQGLSAIFPLLFYFNPSSHTVKMHFHSYQHHKSSTVFHILIFKNFNINLQPYIVLYYVVSKCQQTKERSCEGVRFDIFWPT